VCFPSFHSFSTSSGSQGEISADSMKTDSSNRRSTGKQRSSETLTLKSLKLANNYQHYPRSPTQLSIRVESLTLSASVRVVNCFAALSRNAEERAD
jgi:hypothetical protein